MHLYVCVWSRLCPVYFSLLATLHLTSTTLAITSVYISGACDKVNFLENCHHTITITMTINLVLHCFSVKNFALYCISLRLLLSVSVYFSSE